LFGCYKRFLSCLVCSSRPSTKYYFPHHTLFHFICPHRPAGWAGSRAESPVFSNVLLSRMQGTSDPSFYTLDSQLTLINLGSWKSCSVLLYDPFRGFPFFNSQLGCLLLKKIFKDDIKMHHLIAVFYLYEVNTVTYS
jgi:hypothetical protein